MQLLDEQLCQNDGNALVLTVCITETSLPASKPVVNSLLEEGEGSWIPGVPGLEDVAGDLSPGEPVGDRRRLGLAEAVSDWAVFWHSVLFLDHLCHPAGDRMTTTEEVLQKCDVTEWQWGSASVGKARRDVPGGLEQGEHLKKHQGNPPGETVRNPLDFSTGQKQPEDARSKEVCQEERQNPSDECANSLKRNSGLVNCQRTHIADIRFKCLECEKRNVKSCNLLMR